MPSQIKGLKLSFSIAKRLWGLAEMLPKGPEWWCKAWSTVYRTKRDLTLFYHDPLDCIQSILHNPLIKDYIKFKPLCIFELATRVMCIYTEWLTSNAAWSMQVSSLSQSVFFPANIPVEQITWWSDCSWGCPIIQQDQYICDDRWTPSPSTSHQSCESSHEFSDESNKPCLSSTCTTSYLKIHSQRPKNMRCFGKSHNPWMFRLYPEASQKSCWSRYNDVGPTWIPSLCFHSSHSLHCWCAGGLSIIRRCRKNIAYHYGILQKFGNPF